MTHEIWLTVAGLAAASFVIRLAGFALALRLPQDGAWARGMDALPGCLIIALVALLMMKGGPHEWVAGAVVLAVATRLRNVPALMLLGMAIVAGFRVMTPV